VELLQKSESGEYRPVEEARKQKEKEAREAGVEGAGELRN